MKDSKLNNADSPNRLCSEIQLFDLCDLGTCYNKNGRFCTDPILLSKFEKIAEVEFRTPERFVSEENDDAETDDNDEYDDEFAMENFEGGEDNDWEDED